MKGVKKKIAVYSLLGLMQVGLLIGVASASPKYADEPSEPLSYFEYLVQCCEDTFCQKQCSDTQTDCKQISPENDKDANSLGQPLQKKCNK